MAKETNKKGGEKEPKKRKPGTFELGDPRAGRPKGCQNKVSRNMRETLRHVWSNLQEDPQKSLLAMAGKNPRWFYELTKGCFPKDLFIHGDIDVNSMSRAEIESRIRELIGTLGIVPAIEGAGEDTEGEEL